MRRRLVERIPRFSRHRESNLLAQSLQFLLQLVNLLLLAIDSAVEFFQQFFAEAQFYFDLGKAGFHIWIVFTSTGNRSWRVCHA